ncbi:hypothetical protein [Paraclostridium sordellii]|uniref:hypothetical protein n=1 Tax=Paraclostridium sordellii TaxID=1505 RepID=UPI003A8A1885
MDRVEEENFISITAFSKDIKTDYIEYLGNKGLYLNLQIYKVLKAYLYLAF